MSQYLIHDMLNDTEAMIALSVYTIISLFLSYYIIKYLCTSNRKKSLSDTILKTRVTTEGLVLLVGKLSERIENTENDIKMFSINASEVMSETKDQLDKINEIVLIMSSHIKDNKDVIEELKNRVRSHIKSIKNEMNFMDQAIGDFTYEEYIDFKEDVNENIRLHHNALFVPDNDSSNYSE